jgi:hypothetical protein
VGASQEDQFQGFGFSSGNSSGGTLANIGEASTAVFAGLTHAKDAYRATSGNSTALIGDDGTNGTPRTGAETRMKNYTKGVDYVILMQEI